MSSFTDVTPLHTAEALIGGFIVLFSLVSYFIKNRIYISEAFVSLLVGIIIGPIALDLVNPGSWGNENEVTLELTRIVIGIQVMAAGVALPPRYLKKEWLSVIILVLPVMVLMWFSTAFFIWLIIPGLQFLDVMLIAACVTPTDPVLANSIVRGRFAEDHVPPHLRNILSAESGANDGLGFPFLFFAIFLIKYSDGYGIGKWFYQIWLYQIALSIIIGLVIGYLARKLLLWAERNQYTDKESFLAYAIALAICLIGTVSIIGSDDLLACFIAGNSLTWDDWFRKETEEAKFQEVIDSLLNLAIFVYIGTIIPWSDFSSDFLRLSPWRLVLLGICVLIFRRLPFVVGLTKAIPAIRTFREGLFAGWFGPIGVGAVFYAMVAVKELEEVDEKSRLREMVFPIVSFLVLCSVFVHGFTVPVLAFGTRITARTLRLKQRLTMGSIREALEAARSKKEQQRPPSTTTMTSLEMSETTKPSVSPVPVGDSSVLTGEEEKQQQPQLPPQPIHDHHETEEILEENGEPSATRIPPEDAELTRESLQYADEIDDNLLIYDEHGQYVIEDSRGNRVTVLPNPNNNNHHTLARTLSRSSHNI